MVFTRYFKECNRITMTNFTNTLQVVFVFSLVCMDDTEHAITLLIIFIMRKVWVAFLLSYRLSASITVRSQTAAMFLWLYLSVLTQRWMCSCLNCTILFLLLFFCEIGPFWGLMVAWSVSGETALRGAEHQAAEFPQPLSSLHSIRMHRNLTRHNLQPSRPT